MHSLATRVLSVTLVVLGIAMLVSTLARGGGPLALGVLMGLLFAGAGAARLWLTRDEERGR